MLHLGVRFACTCKLSNASRSRGSRVGAFFKIVLFFFSLLNDLDGIGAGYGCFRLRRN